MKKLNFIILIFIMFLGGFNVSYSAEYTVLTPLPGTTDCGTDIPSDGSSTTCQTRLSKYYPAFFKLLIGVGAGLAFIMLTYEGFQYMLTSSFLTKNNAKEKMESTAIGLGLIVCSYAILYTINPNILNLDLKFPKIKLIENTLSVLSEVPNGTIGPSHAGPVVVGNCDGCQKLTSSTLNLSVNVQSSCSKTTDGCFLKQDLVSKLQNLQGDQPGMQLTEVWPPTRNHVSPCHKDGSCVDATFGRQSSAQEIITFMKDARKNGLYPDFETSDPSLASEIQRLGLPEGTRVLTLPRCSSILLTNCITGSHFSIYNNK